MDSIPPSVKKVEKAMEAMIGEIQKAHLLPKQKEVRNVVNTCIADSLMVGRRD